jgi:ATP-binding cassette subfamily B (MDR/TAP) protein 1
MQPDSRSAIQEESTTVAAKEKDKAKEKKEEAPLDAKKVSIYALYRFAEKTEKILLVLGIIMAAAFGVCNPLVSVLMGNAMGDFGDEDGANVFDSMKNRCLMMFCLGFAALALSAINQFLWAYMGNRLGVKVKKLYLESVLKKSVSWFDLNRPQELPTKIVSLITKYQDGIGERVGKVIVSLTMFVSGLVIAFVYGWQLALVIVGLSPIIMFAAYLIGVANEMGMETTKRGYAKCGGYAEEALSAIRTVYAFCAEKIEESKYLAELGTAQKATLKNSCYLGIALGLINFAMSLSHGLGYFIGSFFIQYNVRNHSMDKNYDCATVMTVFFSALFATFSLGMIAPLMKNVGAAQTSAYDIYELIDSVVGVGKDAPTKKIPLEEFKGEIEFHNVTFYYPTRPDIKVLDNFSMVFKNGAMTGVCGETGSGKSTIIQLIERFYTPNEGKITVDGIDINTLDMKWWREMIGYVGQEPVLFNTSIKGNIEYGKPGASMEEIESVARKANAEEFIRKLEKGYETPTGSEGSKMSGGQKQRLAIARCLIKSPKILLLDEATSALDNTSEKKVQEAFNELQKQNGMTVIAIAHRLSTIKNAEKIIVLHDGVLKEEGNDQELRAKNTIYANLCRLQEGVAEEEELKRVDSFGKKDSVRKTSTLRKLSEGKPEEKKLSKEEEEAKTKETALKMKEYKSRIWKASMEYKVPFIISMILGCVCGLYMPVTGILFGMVSMDLQEENDDELRRKVNWDFVGFLVSGGLMFIISMIMFSLFGYVGSKVTYHLRETLYCRVLEMEVGWFDLPANLPSSLNNILSEGTEKINDVVGMVAAFILQSITSLIFAIAISLVFSWKISLIVLGCVPMIGSASFIEAKTEFGFAKEREKLYKDSMQILTETVKNFRTVASFSSEDRILMLYSQSLELPLQESNCSAIVNGILYGVSQSITYFIYAGLFYFSAFFMKEHGDDPRKMFMAVYALFFAAASVGQMQQYAPDMGVAYSALHSVYGITDQKPAIFSPQNPTSNEICGRIEFKNVKFKYPTRNDYVLQDFSAVIEAGQKVAIVGISGSGKSTIIQLIERFYDVESGQILIDGVDIKEYSLENLRRSIGYVPQEPVLFDTTIEENVKYGNSDRTHEEVKQACEIADATDFIMKDSDEVLPVAVIQSSAGLHDEKYNIGKGFNRKVGAKGSLLSGGQKQRLAIARAVLKQPKIMLFDEATSALDSETEKMVQKALNQVSNGRTSIVVAHRLGTIEDDDIILVLENGKLVESGNKRELENKKGSFHKLYKGVMTSGKAKK